MGDVTAEPVPDSPRFVVAPKQTPGPWTYADLERYTAPDSYGYEIIEGRLLVSPSPGPPHFFFVYALTRALEAACPPVLIVTSIGFDFELGDSTVQPDIYVADPRWLQQRPATHPPLLAVEVLSPSGRSIDLHSKRGIYERAGVPDYWIGDPRVPSLLALHLESGRYVEVAHATGEQAFTAQTPFPVTVVPARLLDELR